MTFLKAIGGWPVIDTNWNASTFDMEELMASLRIMHNDILVSLVGSLGLLAQSPEERARQT